jgi:hypothetical protein
MHVCKEKERFFTVVLELEQRRLVTLIRIELVNRDEAHWARCSVLVRVHAV